MKLSELMELAGSGDTELNDILTEMAQADPAVKGIQTKLNAFHRQGVAAKVMLDILNKHKGKMVSTDLAIATGKKLGFTDEELKIVMPKSSNYHNTVIGTVLTRTVRGELRKHGVVTVKKEGGKDMTILDAEAFKKVKMGGRAVISYGK